MTFSLLGRCASTGRLGMVISSSSPAVAARCAHIRPGVGVAASQNVTDPRLGPQLLERLAALGDPHRALEEVVAGAPHIAHRQLALIDPRGRTASYTGAEALGTTGECAGADCVAIGNLLAGDDVLEAMVAAFTAGAHADTDIADRLLGALRAGVEAGGEAGPVHSAGLVVAGEVEWPIVDLRVDWHDDPVAELGAVWSVYRPQVKDYVTRALDPTAAPAYGVPGE